jgi:hypothetical protein
MTTSKKQKIYSEKKLEKEKQRIFKEAQQLNQAIFGFGEDDTATGKKLNLSGLFGGKVYEPKIKYNFAPGDKGIDNGNAYITLGRDRPSGKASGFGGQGAVGANAIDIVVGRLSSAKKPDGTIADNSFSADAARIYISQLTNIDFNFGIDEGKSGYMEGRSGIGIKADGVRVIGREGVKIVTGKSQSAAGFGGKGETNSLGGKISQPAPLIELIAGNNTQSREVAGGLFNSPEKYDTLQGVAMGQNTVESMKDLSTILDKLTSSLFNFVELQTQFNAGLAGAVALPAPAAGVAVGGLVAANTLRMLFQVWVPYYQARIGKFMWEVNHLYPFGYRYIESRNVKST